MVGLSRRAFLQVTAGGAGAMAAAIGLQQAGKLIPYIVPPEEIKPCQWAAFATTCRECPAGCGMHVRHRDGRALKAEGNPQNPVNRGALCARGQSAVQGLYDPDRLRQPLRRPHRDASLEPASWATAVAAVADLLRNPRKTVHFFSDVQTGSLAEIQAAFAARHGSGPVLHVEPCNYEPLRDAHRTLLGLDAIPRYRLERARFILSLGADFLETWISPVEFARGFSHMHRIHQAEYGRDPFESPPHEPGTLVYVGPRLSMTAANADEFLHLPSGAEGPLVLAMVQELLSSDLVREQRDAVAAVAKTLGAEQALSRSGVEPSTISRLARAFAGARGAVALACPTAATGQAARLASQAATLLNVAVGSVGPGDDAVVDFSQPHALGRAARMRDVTDRLASLGPDDVVFLHNVNMAFFLPDADAGLQQAGAVIALSSLPDETAELADVVLPVDSPLESWGDYEPYAGLHSLMQPTMARLHDSRTAGDILLAISQAVDLPLAPEYASGPPEDFSDWLQQRWRHLHPHHDWEDALRAGGEFSRGAGVSPALTVPLIWTQDGAQSPSTSNAGETPAPRETSRDGFNLWLWPSVFLFDGRGANRPWLQEAPDPTSQATWSSWADMHPDRAAALHLRDGDTIHIQPQTATDNTAALSFPVRITADVSPDTLAVVIGQGHQALGDTARDVGANAFGLRPIQPTQNNFLTVRVHRDAGRSSGPLSYHPTSTMQDQHRRELLQWATPAQAAAAPRTSQGNPIRMPLPEGFRTDAYQPHEHTKHRWAMAIDLQRCVGCGACTVACYAENNIPVVGPAEVDHGREMAWLKIIPYRSSHDAGRLGFLPILCQHCDAAPCEPVCPVYASMHTEEGLNAQIYNRCIGTRYCNNNCPYKARRFNWFDRTWSPTARWQLNPEVTVRERGVMEKCTFCIQRIRQGQHRALREGRPLRDGEIQPACVATCPTSAMIFGDLLRPDSLVTRLFRHDPRRYQVLGELNTKPAIVYLRRVTGAP